MKSGRGFWGLLPGGGGGDFCAEFGGIWQGGTFVWGGVGPFLRGDEKRGPLGANFPQVFLSRKKKKTCFYPAKNPDLCLGCLHVVFFLAPFAFWGKG